MLEPEAVAWFMENICADVQEVNEEQKFHIHPEIDWLGCTPDGRVLAVELLEVKCPSKPPKELPDDWYMRYMPQIQGQMQITGAEACYLLAYHEEGQKVWCIDRSDEYWEWMLPMLDEFWGYVQRDEEPPAFKRGQKPVFEGELTVEIIHE